MASSPVSSTPPCFPLLMPCPQMLSGFPASLEEPGAGSWYWGWGGGQQERPRHREVHINETQARFPKSISSGRFLLLALVPSPPGCGAREETAAGLDITQSPGLQASPTQLRP